MSASLINFSALQQTAVKEQPFPYLVVPNFIKPEMLSRLAQAFPDIQHRGSIPASSVASDAIFQQLIAELEGDELRQTLADKFDLDLAAKPTMLTLRGNTSEKDGRIHTDSRSKMITVLLYMNETWETKEGQLRLLNSPHSLDDYCEEVSPLAGTCLIFKVTPNGWHGHTQYVGKRLSLQLNYLTSDAALAKHLNHHKLTAFIKRWLPFLRKSTEETY